MAGPTTTTQIDQAVEKFLASSRFTMQERPGVVKQLVRNETLPSNEGPSVNIPKYGTVSTFALTEGVDMAQAQQITDTLMTITPAEYGAQVVLTDMMLMESKDEFFAVAGRILGESFDRQQDQTLCDDFASFSLIVGAAGTAMHQGHIMAGQASIKYNGPADGSAGRGGEPGPDPIYCVQTPAALHVVRKSISGPVQAVGAAAQNGSADIPSLNTSFNVGGVNVHSDINITKDTSDDAIGVIASQDANILVSLGGGPSAERERDASLRAWEINFVGRWARGEYDDNWGRACTMDSALPLS